MINEIRIYLDLLRTIIVLFKFSKTESLNSLLYNLFNNNVLYICHNNSFVTKISTENDYIFGV